MAAIDSLDVNLAQAIEEQSKSLLGADLVLHSQEAFTPDQEKLIQELGGEQSREVDFATMIYFPRTQDSRLAQARALSGRFPYYGSLETEPANAAEVFRAGGGALADETLLRQFNAQVGDSIRIGNLTTRVIGRLEKAPGETVALSAIAPRVYISMDDAARTGLLQDASLARYRACFKFGPESDAQKILARIRPRLEQLRLGHDTVEERKRELGRSLDNLYHFLNLVGFVALLLGGVGVAGAIHVHVKDKLGTVAVLRCLGTTVAQTFAIYLTQGAALGLIGALLGGALGVAIQLLLPRVLADFLPISFQFHAAWWAIARAVGTGFAICLLFALLPLLSVRRISPLAALRVSFDPQGRRSDPLQWLVRVALAVGIIAFALTQTRNWRIGIAFAMGLGVTFGALALTAKLLMAASRRIAARSLRFTTRQGIANLHRPNNRTLMLLLSLGLGTFLMMSLYLVQRALLTQVVAAGGKSQSNVVLFDIQPPQLQPISNLLRSLNLPIRDSAPILTMRLSAVKGRSVEAILSEGTRGRRWAFRREYRSTYADHLRDGEKIISGAWVARVAGGTTNPVPVSLEQGIAKDLGVALGDELKFDVQGIPVTTRVASLREVEWRRIQPNFFVEFPEGALDGAPAMWVLVTQAASAEESAALQREVVKSFPNVSVIDLTLVLQTVDSILGKIAFVIRFMAMFTVLTGLLVLMGAMLTSRYHRIRESVLLRTLGASRRQILRILVVEFLALGLLASLSGLLLAVAAAWALARFLLHVPFVPEPLPLLAALIAVPALTLVTGMFMSRGVLDYPPLAVLRSED